MSSMQTRKLSPLQKKLMYHFVDWPNNAMCICGHIKKKHTYYNPSPGKWLPCRCKGTRACDCQGFVPEILPVFKSVAGLACPIVEPQVAVETNEPDTAYRRISID